ncbi:MAG: isochorismatase family protein [Candidatus Gracilibacteria bacterium]
MKNTALIVVDVTGAFADKKLNELYVSGGEKIISTINRTMQEVKERGGIVLASREEHLIGNISFASNYVGKFPITQVSPGDPRGGITLKEVLAWKTEEEGLRDTAGFTKDELIAYLKVLGGTMAVWPNHSVKDTEGAQFMTGLDTSLIDHVVIKGESNTEHPYSAFQAVEKESGLTTEELCDKQGVREIKFQGLATDYCVRDSVLDFARTQKYKTELILSGCRGVSPETEKVALESIQQLGTIISL